MGWRSGGRKSIGWCAGKYVNLTHKGVNGRVDWRGGQMCIEVLGYSNRHMEGYTDGVTDGGVGKL